MAHIYDELCWDHGGACGCLGQGGDIRGVELRVHQNALKQGRRPGHDGDGLRFDGLEYGGYIENSHGIDGGAFKKRGQPARLVAKAVEEGVDNEIAIVGIEPQDIREGGERLQILTVGSDYAFGSACCARGE